MASCIVTIFRRASHDIQSQGVAQRHLRYVFCITACVRQINFNDCFGLLRIFSKFVADYTCKICRTGDT